MSNDRRVVNLALQGGGAHGAFTWGVLDKLLEDGRFAVEGISATGSGAVNAAVLAQGWARGGPDGARQALDQFWRRFSRFSFLGAQPGWLDRLTGDWDIDDSPSGLWYDLVDRLASPYQLNPLDISPLRIVLEETIDIGAVQGCAALQLFVTATNVRTGKIRVFGREALTIDALLAASCIPQVYRAVMIDGDPYWDGGMMGNPALFPLIYGCGSPDIVIVQLDPIVHPGTPRSASGIIDRVNEITFNANLMREMRAVAFVLKLLDDDRLSGPEIDRLKRLRIHMIGDEERMRRLGFVSKFNTDGAFLDYLREAGRARAAAWLDETSDAVGSRSSVDIGGVFL